VAAGPGFDPPEQIDLGLSKALDLLAVSWVLNEENPMSVDLLRASEAARHLGIPTKDLLGLVHSRRIRYVMVDGIAHVPVDALDEFRDKAS